jgi:hypothetical protein
LNCGVWSDTPNEELASFPGIVTKVRNERSNGRIIYDRWFLRIVPFTTVLAITEKELSSSFKDMLKGRNKDIKCSETYNQF